MMKILMGTDGSVHASGAMLAASRLLRRTGIDVDVLCVAPELMIRQTTAQVRGGSPVHRSYEERLASSARRTLDDAQRILAHAHLKTHGLFVSGSPAEKLLALAPDYDLTVVGAYGNHDRKQPGLGAVSSRLLQLSTSNIMIGRELVNEDDFRILVALDSSEASFAALGVLGTLLDSTSLDVTLMHVVELPWANMSMSDFCGDDTDMQELSEYQMQLERELRRTAEVTMTRAQRQLERLQIPSSPIIEDGEPALELCSHAEEGGYDLIIAGATGVSDVKHAVLGSVSLKLAWNAPCSVIIVRRTVG
jgi:nucleotide-binding universal stress UspA family protein